ncbi:MAG TPA: zf-HC2 domain-containing protein [Acidimicrobiales bacterium]
MNCDECRAVVSARLDGEAGALETAAADAHLAGCASCTAWYASAERLHRLVRVQAAPAVPDLTATILARAHPPRLGRGEWTRTALIVVALTQLVLAVPALLGHDTGATVHLARHIGALTAALAIGYLYAAWRPIRAFGLLPIAGALGATMLFTASLDVLQGRVGVAGEASHILDFAALALLWMLAGRPWWQVRGRRRARTGPPVAPTL